MVLEQSKDGRRLFPLLAAPRPWQREMSGKADCGLLVPRSTELVEEGVIHFKHFFAPQAKLLRLEQLHQTLAIHQLDGDDTFPVGFFLGVRTKPSVPLGMSTPGFPAIVTSPGIVGCLK
jgi:hypothetical protein